MSGLNVANAINIKTGIILFDDGSTGKISTMLDADGEKTNDWRKCETAVFQLPSGNWTFVKMKDFENVPTN